MFRFSKLCFTLQLIVFFWKYSDLIMTFVFYIYFLHASTFCTSTFWSWNKKLLHKDASLDYLVKKIEKLLSLDINNNVKIPPNICFLISNASLLYPLPLFLFAHFCIYSFFVDILSLNIKSARYQIKLKVNNKHCAFCSFIFVHQSSFQVCYFFISRTKNTNVKKMYQFGLQRYKNGFNFN